MPNLELTKRKEDEQMSPMHSKWGDIDGEKSEPETVTKRAEEAEKERGGKTNSDLEGVAMYSREIDPSIP